MSHAYREALRIVAGPRSFERGVAYAQDGRVSRLRERGDAVSAIVDGSQSYSVRVRLSGDPNAVEGACDCPVGRDGSFCKHCVATALAWLDRGEQGRAFHEDELLRSWLESATAESMRTVIFDEVDRNDELRSRLLLRASQGDSEQIRLAINRALDDRGAFVPYGAAASYVRGIDEAVDAMVDLRDPGTVIELTEHTLRGLEAAMDVADDSDGHFGQLSSRLEEIHLVACEEARPDPVALAERLFRWEHEGAWELFHRASERYADVLGAAGLARYREFAEEQWEAVPERRPGERSGTSYYRITAIMESLAIAEDDFEGLIEVMSRDLSSPWAFCRISEACRDAGRLDEGIEWCRRGIDAFEPDLDPRLAWLLAELHVASGDRRKAAEAGYQAFAARPSLEGWRRLRELSDPAGTWPADRERALAHVERVAADRVDEASRARFAWQRRATADELVRIHLEEGQPDEAWSAAGRFGASDGVWLELARRRGETHPDDALAVYRRLVESAIAGRDRRAYRGAADLLGEVRILLVQHERGHEFDVELEAVKNAHARKPALLDELSKAKALTAPLT